MHILQRAGAALIALAAAMFILTIASARAADLGGSCCQDLEERVAELEATVVRKGNRKVRLSISGYVSHSVMWWDDGAMSDTYVGDGGANTSRFRFTGTARVATDVDAGFSYEFGFHNNALGAMDQTAGGDDLGGSVAVRESTVWLKHRSLGTIQLGHGSTATDNLILLDTSNSGVATSADVGLYNGGMFLRTTLTGGLVPLTWGNLLNQGISFDTTRRSHVRYTTPTAGGFTLDAAAGEDNFWDVALRYAGELGDFRVAFGAGYSNATEATAFHPVAALAFAGIPATDIKEYKGAASVMHMPSGLFLTGAAGKRNIGWSLNGLGGTLTAKDGQFWHLRGGIEKNFFGPGATTLFVGYHDAKDMVGFTLTGPFATDISSEAHVMEAGVVQAVNAAAMEVFITYKRFDGDVKASGALSGALGVQDFQAGMVGARIKF